MTIRRPIMSLLAAALASQALAQSADPSGDRSEGRSTAGVGAGCSLLEDATQPGDRMQPFQRPGWSRAAAATLDGRQERRTFDEPRTWPLPMIAPVEGHGRGLVWPSFEQDTPVFCFSPKTPVSPGQRDQLDRMLRGPMQPRYNVVTPWASRTVYWSFVPDGLSIPSAGTGDLYSGNSSLFALMDAKFGGDRALWIWLIQSCFDRWANLTGLTFVRVRHNGQEWDDGAAWNNLYSPGLRGDIRIGARNIDNALGILAYAFYPDASGSLSFGGNMVLDASENWQDPASGYRMMRNIIMHELGHAIGIDHVCPANSTKLMEPYLSTAFWGPQHDDMRAAHALYGDAYEPNDTVATARMEGAIAPGATDTVGTIGGTTVPNSSLVSIAGSDVDWYVYDLTVPAPLSISVSPVGTSYLDGAQVIDDCSGTQGTTNSIAQRLLSVSVYGPDGTGLIQTSTAPNLGSSTAPINLTNYTGGRFYVRVSGAGGGGGGTQMYRLIVTAGNASPPFNDACANAIPIGEGTFTGDNGGANTDGSAGTCGTSFGDVWFVYTSPCRGTLDINTCGSTFDTVLSVHRGTCGALSTLLCNDNAAAGGPCTGTASALTFDTVPEETYYIRIAGKTATPGLFTLNVNMRAPANDLCANATNLAASGSVTATICGAGRDAVASCSPLSASPDVWYRYVPSCTGVLRLDSCQSDFDTVLTVYSGSCGGLIEVACNEDSPMCPGTMGGSFMHAPVTAGQTYFIRVSGFAGQAGRFDLAWELTQANDSCASAMAITPGSVQGSLCGARRDLSNTCQAASNSPDVFYSYVPASTGLMTLNTCGSNYDTLLEVFLGTCASLTSVACNDNHNSTTCNSGPTTSRISLSVTAGVTYTIRVSGRNNQSGDFTLTLQQAPSNDQCANAITIAGNVTGTTLNAGRDGTDTCAPLSTSPDVWYRWVSPCAGTLRVNTCGSSYNTVASILSGTCGSLTQLSCSDDIGLAGCPTRADASTTFTTVAAGQTYYIRVSGAAGESGAFTLSVTQTPSNDACAQATAVGQGNVAFDTRCATNDGAVICGASNVSPDVWFRFTSPCNGAVWFNTCNSTLDTVLSVSSGACGSLAGIVCNDNQGSASCPGNAGSSRGAVRAVAGTTYTIRIAGNFGLVGTGNLNIRCCGADFNLSFAVDVQDIFDMLNAWFANLPAADVNGSGSITIQDIFDMLNTWFAGC